MNIAVFADLHGRILLAFKLCARWERETGEKIDLILQAGDMGIFPEHSRLDSATLRYAQKDPTELGFLQDFVTFSEEVAAILAQTQCNLVFVRGNHEDHFWLDNLEQQERGALFSVDVYQRLYCLKTGAPYEYEVGNDHIMILGIGRIGQRGAQLRDTNIQPYEQDKLKRVGEQRIDLLLTHDMPSGSLFRSGGMEEISEMLQEYQPAYHFYGHIGGECKSGVSENGLTQFCKLADLEWHGASQVVHPESMAILRWSDPTTHSLSVVQDAWFKEYSASSWLYL